MDSHLCPNIREPEAAAVHCAYLTDLHKLRPSQNFMICDAGGGTVVSIGALVTRKQRTYFDIDFSFSLR